MKRDLQIACRMLFQKKTNKLVIFILTSFFLKNRDLFRVIIGKVIY